LLIFHVFFIASEGLADMSYDAIVVGTGQAGKPLAFELADEGWEVAVVEQDEIGGSCINYGCTPTKTLVGSARVAYLARRSEEFGIRTGPVRPDMDEMVARKDRVVDQFRSGSEQALKKNERIDVFRGHGRFVDNHSVHVNGEQDRTLTADHVFINTGQVARVPEVEGLGSVSYLTNRSVMELKQVPDHLLIIGGGYIGLEFGQMFRRFGSDVTIIQRGDQLAPLEDPDIADEIRKVLKEDGIDVRLNADASAVRETADGITLTLDSQTTNCSITGSHLLLAAGREPATDQLGLENTGIRTNKHGEIQVNNRLETDVDGVYCMGDVKGGAAFTHISYDDYRVVRDNLLNDANRTIDGRMVPYTIFTDPELGRIGLNETMAEKQGSAYQTATMPMSKVARAIEAGETRGHMKVLVDPETDQLLGASILGISGGEIASMIQIAMMGDLRYQELREGIFSHPTLAESLNNLFSSLD
jgi:pyruvate/2-oxoglutarate dehydrogenase complex dihydrolipoamide dehydrogenase (E3) component